MAPFEWRICDVSRGSGFSERSLQWWQREVSLARNGQWQWGLSWSTRTAAKERGGEGSEKGVGIRSQSGEGKRKVERQSRHSSIRRRNFMIVHLLFTPLYMHLTSSHGRDRLILVNNRSTPGFSTSSELLN